LTVGLLIFVDSLELQVVKKTKEMISKQAKIVAKRADEHEDFITKVISSEPMLSAVQ
jgi:hypothetical protein